jgi:hypothetical protein
MQKTGGCLPASATQISCKSRETELVEAGMAARRLFGSAAVHDYPGAKS